MPTDEALQAVSHKIGALVEEQGSTYMVDNDADPDDGRARRSRQALILDATHDEFDSS